MFYQLKLILTLVYYKYALVESDRKLVYQKDMSEYCRRKVMPSVFLGRHVVEANSQILHFAKLELPYSCFISVRSESGTNIILVIQMVSDENLLNECTKSNNQLLVYEMGETFGGYWGPLPDSLLKQEPFNKTQYYTLKTTPMATTDTMSQMDSENDDDKLTITLATDTDILNDRQNPSDSNDFISLEIPIVNVSGMLVPGDPPSRSAFDINDAFEFIYDVAPRRGTQYDTSILPLVQFSINKQWDNRREGGIDAKDMSKYQVDYNINSFTPDVRLTYAFNNPTTYKRVKLFPKQQYNANRRLNFNKNRTLFVTSHTQAQHKRYHSKLSTKTQNTAINDSWVLIDNLMRRLSKTTVIDDVDRNKSDVSYLLRKISNLKHTFSAYLAPNLSVYDISGSTPVSASIFKQNATISYSPYRFLDSPEDGLISYNMTTLFVNRKIITKDTTTKPTPSVYSVKLLNDSTQTLTAKDNVFMNSFLKKNNITTSVTAKDHSNEFNISTTQFKAQARTNLHNEKPLTGTLVDHESWENLVQIAPVMAVVLNQTVKMEATTAKHSNLQETRVENHSNMKRKKRYIHSIPIKKSRPRFLPPRREEGITSGITYNIGEMHDFAQLVELQDDEMHGRVALRYLRNYIGPAQFNICHHNGTTHRNVFMFNSSRIVIAISNFTLDRMAVILTPARTLFTADARCSKAHLECQVSGVRVCIDSTTACDGIPNCGSYDIYDEDRLMCGAAGDQQHNVYLAAITFMAVVLTILYTVHYWLKRCVPKVSDAFFIYTNGVENELYLDTIMRSPNDDDDGSKFMYHADIFKGVESDSNIYNTRGKNSFGRCLKNVLLCQYFRRKHREKDLGEIIPDSEFYSSLAQRKKMYSFTELEIRKMTGQQLTDTSVQTGESLEMKCFKHKKNVNEPTTEIPQMPKSSESEMTLETLSMLTLDGPHWQKHADELNIMKFLRDIRSDSVRSSIIEETYKTKMSIKNSITTEEKEIENYEYETRDISASTSGTAMITSNDYSQKPGPSGLVKKHLRFEEETILIPPVDQDEEDIGSINERRSVVFGVAKLWRNVDLDTIEEGDDHSSNTTRDYRSFWGLSKKSKK